MDKIGGTRPSLRNSLVELRAVYDGLTDALAIADRKSRRLLHVNRAFCQMFGYAQREALSMTVAGFHPPEHWPAIREWFDRAAHGRGSLAPDLACRRKDGSVFFADIARRQIRFRGRECLLGFFRDISVRKGAEQALRQSEERLRFALASMRAGEWSVDLVDQTSEHSARHDEILGYKKPPLHWTSDKFVEHILPEDRAMVRRIVQEAIRRRTPHDIEYRIRRVDGQIRWIRTTGQHSTNRRGHPSMVGIIEDITPRKEAEQALRQSREELRILVEYSPDIIVRFDRRFRHVFISPAVERILGIPRERVLGKTMAQVGMPPKAFRRWKEYVRAVFTDGREREFDFEVYGRTFRALHMAHRNADGSIDSVVGIGRDITERLRAEQALRDSEEGFRLAFENAKDAIFWADAGTGLVVRCNKAAELLLGWSRQEIVGQHFTTLHPQERLESYTALFSEKAKEGQTTDFEAEALAKNGHPIPVHITSSVTKLGGRVIVQGVFRDITEQKQAEVQRERLNARLREAQKMEAVGRLAGGVAHDFNNLMATVLGIASHLKARRSRDDQEYGLLAQIEDAADTAGRLAHQLLVFAKGGKIKPSVAPFSCVLEGAVRLLEPTMPANITLECCIPENLWHVECDQLQIQQVIVNLCRNAVEAMPNGGHLTIRAENLTLSAPLTTTRPPLAKGQYLCLAVKDDGCGMSPQVLEHAFEPFFTTKEGGHGLGLAAAYGAMRSHDGAIHAASKPGEGSVFRIWLPRSKPA
jgi:two-component system cell cycle sensor histidine kinase/response regulator CckA